MIAGAVAAFILGVSGQIDSLARRIDSIAAAHPEAEIAVAYVDLATGDTLYRNPDVVYHAASTMKVPVMMEILRSVEAGRLSLDQQILLVNQFGSIFDGSTYAIDEDTDTEIYSRLGERYTIRELMRRMIVYSSNISTNALIALVGAARVNEMAHSLGAGNTRVLRGVQDLKAYEAGMNNTLTARDLAILLRSVEDGTAVSRNAAAVMRDLLLAEEGNERIRAGVPPGIPVASKTGDITAHWHDSAVVYPPARAPYVLVVLTRGIREEAAGERLIAEVSRVVYEHAVGGKR